MPTTRLTGVQCAKNKTDRDTKTPLLYLDKSFVTFKSSEMASSSMCKMHSFRLSCICAYFDKEIRPLFIRSTVSRHSENV